MNYKVPNLATIIFKRILFAFMVASINIVFIVISGIFFVSFKSLLINTIVCAIVTVLVSVIALAIARNTAEFSRNIYVKIRPQKPLRTFERLLNWEVPIHYRKAQKALMPLPILSAILLLVYLLLYSRLNEWYSYYCELALTLKDFEIDIIKFFVIALSTMFWVSCIVSLFFFWLAFRADFKHCACPECGNICSHEFTGKNEISHSSFTVKKDKDYNVEKGSVTINDKHVGKIYETHTAHFTSTRHETNKVYEIKCHYCDHITETSETIDSWSTGWKQE